jgi:hypothetical protein
MLSRTSWTSALFWLMVLLYAGYAFTLPVLATGDGPGHVFYGDVLANRLAGTDWYSDFVVRHYAPPYALSHYFIALVGSLVSGVFAEKLMVALCIVLFCTGIRQLARSVGGEDSVLALLAVPFAFQHTLFVGFYGFSLGLGIALWLGAFWISERDRLGGRRTLIFLGLAGLLYLAHPLTMLIGLLFLGLQILWSIATGGWSTLLHLRQLAHLAVAGTGVLVVANYSAETGYPVPSFSLETLSAAGHRFFAMRGIAPHSDPAGLVIRICLVALVLGLALGAIVWRDKARNRDVQYVFGFSLVCLALYVFLPNSFGSVGFFSDRFGIFLIAYLIACAAAYRLPARAQVPVAVAICAVTLVSFYLDTRIPERLAEMNRVLVEAPLITPGGTGAIVVEGEVRLVGYDGSRYWPCLWSAAHYFRRSRTSMLNVVWTGQPYWIVAPAEYRQYYAKEPHAMTEYLTRGLDEPGEVELPERLDLLISARCRGDEPDHAVLDRVATHYGLERMPWSTKHYVFYSKPGAVME